MSRQCARPPDRCVCIVVAVVIAVSGCGVSYSVRHVEAPKPAHLPESARPIESLVLAVEHVARTEDSVGTNVPRATVQRIVGEIRRQGVFSEVFGPRDNFRAPPDRVRLVVTLREDFDRHRVANHLRTVAAMATVFVSTVLFPLEYGISQEMQLDFRFPDGNMVTYASSTRVRVTMTDTTRDWYSEIRRRATTQNLVALLARIRHDMAASSD